VNTKRALPALALALTLGLSVAACSGTTQADPTPSSLGSTTDAVTQWCLDYGTITNALSNSGSEQSDAQASLATLDDFDQLWVTAEQSGYVNADEKAANQRAIVAYRAVIQLIADGAAQDSPEVIAAGTNMTATTDKDAALLDSASTKVIDLCSTSGAAASPSSN
jgi:hypothetical protein